MTIDDLIPYKNNAKVHTREQVEELALNIQEMGFCPAIEVDHDFVIISGHGRYEAAKLLGLKELKVGVGKAAVGEKFIPVIVRDDLSEEKTNAKRISDNKLNESKWNRKLLKVELKKLSPEMRRVSGFPIKKVAVNFDPIEEPEIKKKPQKVTSIICPKCSHEFDI